MFPILPIRLARRAGAACVLAGSLLVSMPALAATFCVSTSAQLQNALTTAEDNGEDDVIRIEEGNYAVPLNGFIYQAFANSNDDDYSLEISGGWYAPFNFACLGHHNSPFATILDGGGLQTSTQTSDLVILARAHSNVTVRWLTLINGQELGSRGGGLRLYCSQDSCSGTFTVEHMAFIGNEADYAGGLELTTGGPGSRARVLNNLFTLNQGIYDHPAAEIAVTGSAAGIDVTNNTIVANDDSQTYRDVWISSEDTPIVFANNNVWSQNISLDVSTFYPVTDFALVHNNLHGHSGAAATVESGNISVEPVYQPGLFHYTPVRNSPLVDAGITPRAGADWYLTNHDLEGHARSIGQVDIGAYEEDDIFNNGYEPPVF